MNNFQLKEFVSRKGKLISIDGVHIGQTPKTIEFFTNLIQKNEFETIIEIGTHKGGFTYFLNKVKPLNCKLVSFEINKKIIEEQVLKENIDIRIGDCFQETFKNQIKELLKNGKKSLILCDGGNKNKEFNTFSEFIKVGDIIMLHDYQHSSSLWKKYTQQANWSFAPESSYKHIEQSVQKFSLKEYMYDEFCSTFWGCFTKK